MLLFPLCSMFLFLFFCCMHYAAYSVFIRIKSECVLLDISAMGYT